MDMNNEEAATVRQQKGKQMTVIDKNSCR